MIVTTTMDGIRGLDGREPVGAVLCIGRKGERGEPIENDRFFFVVPHAEGSGRDARRAQHPAFQAFNAADPERRRVIYGNLVHARRQDCFEYHLRNQVEAGKPAHPDMRPFCIGDGDRAVRWFAAGGPQDFRDITCPNEKCEFRLGAKPSCKPWMRFLFRPRWPSTKAPLPSPLTKLTSQSWHSVAAFRGLFRYVGEQATAFGLPSFSLFGLPIMITLERKTKPSERRSFPIMAVTVDGDLHEFLWAQRARAIEVAQPIAALTDREQQDPAEMFMDRATITPGIPAEKA